MAGFYCYILECSDGTLYTGWTTDPERRLHEHNAGRGAQYTSARRPLKLVYLEEHPSRHRAMVREHQIKRRGRQNKLALIDTQQGDPLAAWKEEQDE